MRFPADRVRSQAVVGRAVGNGVGGGVSLLRQGPRPRTTRHLRHCIRSITRFGPSNRSPQRSTSATSPAELGGIQPQPLPVQPQHRSRCRPEPAMEPRRQFGRPRSVGDGCRGHRRRVTEETQHPLCASRGRRSREDQSGTERCALFDSILVIALRRRVAYGHGSLPIDAAIARNT